MNRKRIIYVIIVIITIVLIPTLLLTKSKYGFLSDEQSYSLLGYFGSIAGSFLALFGVYITIKENRKDKKEEFDITYKPLIIVGDVSYEKMSNYDLSDVFFSLNGISNIQNENIIRFYIKNTGRGEAYIYRIEAYEDKDNESDHFSNFKDEKYNKYIINPGSKSLCTIIINNVDTNKEIILLEEYRCYIDIYYYDCLKRNNYRTTITIVFNFGIKDDDNLENNKFVVYGNNILFISEIFEEIKQI